MVEEISVIEEDWDHLILLDACRYDYFEEVYKDYLEGELRKVRSVASHTADWLERVFDDEKFEGIVYVSANPLVNSKGIKSLADFDARKHFAKIVDVWDEGWDEELKTVHPEEVSKATKRMRLQFPEKRIISHYMQPHAPYVSLGPLRGGLKGPIYQLKGKKAKERTFGSRIRKFFGVLAQRVIGRKRTRKILSKLGLRSSPLLEQIVEEQGEDALQDAYRKNLRFVLEEVSELVKHLPGKVVITADHGELLGEEGLYAHPKLVDLPSLRNVPWFEVENAGKKPLSDDEKKQIKNRIQKLKRKQRQSSEFTYD